MSRKEQQATYVPKTTHRRARIIAQVFGITVPDAYKQAIDELMVNHLEQIDNFLKGGDEK